MSISDGNGRGGAGPCVEYHQSKAGRELCDGQLRLVEILRVQMAQLRNLPIRQTNLQDHQRNIGILVKLDNQDIHHANSVARTSSCCINDDFVHEISNNFSQLQFVISESGRIPRNIGRICIKKRDIVKHSGEDRWYRVSTISRQNDVSGQICLDIRTDPNKSSLSIKVVDYSGLNVRDPEELYLLVTMQESGRLESKRLQIGSNKESSETLVMECDTSSKEDTNDRPQLRMTLWQDAAGSYNSYFHGQVRITLDDQTLRSCTAASDQSMPQWYYLKPRMSMDENGESTAENTDPSRAQLGELRLRLFYTADHILPLELYKPLRVNLLKSLQFHPFCASPAGLLEYLPNVSTVAIARPLMKIFVQSGSIRQLLRVLCTDDITKCQDVNTLFRSQSLATKIIHEQMKFFGHHYLVISIKPVIDMIYNERKCCEVDSERLKEGESVETNKLNLIVYGEIAFARVIDSSNRCPMVLREMFSDLREIAASFFPGREDVQRLVLSSFIIMRFFAAAILDPKSFGLKRDQPEGVVRRTLVLLSKILQRLSNCVVSANLTQKETWFLPVLERFTDEQHRLAMTKFLNRISMAENDSNMSAEKLPVLRDGFFIEKSSREKRRILKNLINQKRRYVMLKETEICWQKTKADLEPKGRMLLQEVSQIEPVEDAKNVFRIASPDCEIQFQAPSSREMTEWIVQIQKQRKRQLIIALRSSEPNDLFEIDTERELEAIHMILYDNAETLKHWKNALEGTELPQGQPALPAALQEQINCSEDPEGARRLFYTSLQDVLHGTLVIENAHREIVNRFIKQMRFGKGSHELPIGDDNYLLLKSRFYKTIDE